MPQFIAFDRVASVSILWKTCKSLRAWQSNSWCVTLAPRFAGSASLPPAITRSPSLHSSAGCRLSILSGSVFIFSSNKQIVSAEERPALKGNAEVLISSWRIFEFIPLMRNSTHRDISSVMKEKSNFIVPEKWKREEAHEKNHSRMLHIYVGITSFNIQNI